MPSSAGRSAPAKAILVPISKHFVKHIDIVPAAGTVSRPACLQPLLAPSSLSVWGRRAGGASPWPELQHRASEYDTLKMQRAVSDETTAARHLTAVTIAERAFDPLLQPENPHSPAGCHVGVSAAMQIQTNLWRERQTAGAGTLPRRVDDAGLAREDRPKRRCTARNAVFCACEWHTAPDLVRPDPAMDWRPAATSRAREDGRVPLVSAAILQPGGGGAQVWVG
jgi:hypothetical protein